MHFGFWISSLRHTSVASSVVLVTTYPLLVAAASPLVTGDRPARRTVLGILVALAGSAVIAYHDAGVSEGALWGNLLAVLGSATVAGHFLIGRRLRVRLSLLAYVAVVYPVAALCLLAAALAAGDTLAGFAPATYLWMALLGLGPQVLGHSTLNWALKHLTAVAVTTAVMAEPVGASLLVWLALGEAPARLQALGGAVVLTGVALALTAERQHAAA
jgi:drug/metabolite transporter (DMT)-like permease